MRIAFDDICIALIAICLIFDALEIDTLKSRVNALEEKNTAITKYVEGQNT